MKTYTYIEQIKQEEELEYERLELELQNVTKEYETFLAPISSILTNDLNEINKMPNIKEGDDNTESFNSDEILTEEQKKQLFNCIILLDIAPKLTYICHHTMKKNPQIFNNGVLSEIGINIPLVDIEEAFDYLSKLGDKERKEILSTTSEAYKLETHINNGNLEEFISTISKTEKGVDEMLRAVSGIIHSETFTQKGQEGLLLALQNNDEDAETMFRHLEGNINKIKHLSPKAYDAAQSKINEEFSLYKICISSLTVIVDFLSEASIKHIRNIICKDEYTSILRPIHLEIIRNPVFSMVSRKELHIKRSIDLMTKIYGSDCTEVKTAKEALNDLKKKKEVGRKKDVWNANIKGREVDFGNFLKENIWDILIEDLDKEILISSYGEKKKSKINEEQRKKTIKQIALALICSCLCGDKIKITSSFVTTAKVLTEISINTLKKYIEIFTAINSIKTLSHSKGIKKKITSLDDYEENELKKGAANNIQKEILKQVSNTSCRTILEQNIKTLNDLMLKYKVLLNELTTEFLFD